MYRIHVWKSQRIKKNNSDAPVHFYPDTKGKQTITEEKVKIILEQSTDEAKNSASLMFPNRGSHSEYKTNSS